MQPSFDFPGGKKFAFTIMDDTDVATEANVRPLYELLRDLGMRTTKTVWPLSIDAPSSDFVGSETLGDPPYRAFALELASWGFELTWHSAAMESSARPQVLEALQRFAETFGHYPRVHANHAENRENIYWGVDRVDLPIVKRLLSRGVLPRDHYQGHVPDSQFWWGDACARHIEYARNLTFNGINLAAFNPSTPYVDPLRPLARRWFSACDAEDAKEFCELLRPSNLDGLEREGGFCILATHFGKGFTDNGEVLPCVRKALEDLAGRPGWFPTTGQLLDWLWEQRESDVLPPAEWKRMQVRFLFDGMARRLRRLVLHST